MSCGPRFGFGLQRLVDSAQRWQRSGGSVYLRLRNFPDLQGQDFSDLGFAASPTGSAVGTTDIPIVPPPSVTPVSMHNIGMSAGKLRFGAKSFFVSATFVDAQVVAQNLLAQTVALSADTEHQSVLAQSLVWRGRNVVGLVADGLLYSIEDVQPYKAAGKVISWSLTCNANEVR